MKPAGAITVLALLVFHGSVMGQEARTEIGDTDRSHILEIEPNDHWSAANPVSNNHYFGGEISPEGDIDWWGTGPRDPGTLVFVYCDTGSSINRDSQLGVYHYDWVDLTLMEFDDDDGPNLSSCVAGTVLPETGHILYRLNDYHDNGEISPYDLHQHLTINQGNQELEPNDDSGTANGMDIMVHQVGSLPPGDPSDWFFFDADAGDLLVVIMDDDPDDDQILLDSEIAIIAGDGSTVLAEGDNGDGDANCAGGVVAPTDGTYFIRISDGGTGGGDVDYRFVLLINGVLVPVELQRFTID